MKATLLLALMLTAVTTTSSAADFAKCNPGGNQLELDACAADDFSVADGELNRVYNALLAKEANNADFVKKLRAAQHAWIEFRDAELAAMYACENRDERICWGSMLPMCYLSYKAKLTKERTKRLRTFLEEGQPADECH